jgi:glycerol-3-phosphate O-acyltransferase
MPETAIGWILTLLLCVAGYEFIRFAVFRRISGRMRRGALSFVRRHRVRLESARFIDRIWLREALLMDPEVDEIVVQQATSEGVPLRVIRERVSDYVDEIAPAFSITAYYRVGRLVAGTIVRFAYEVVFDSQRFRRSMAQVPSGARVVFIMNHRSNFDYLVLSYGLLKHVALSYAVGEWARVWPLDRLFKAFGSYFVRRGEKDPVYHRVLERFIQLLVGHGGVTGFFLEGRFTRDGAMGHPKSGLVDYILGVQRAHPETEIAFLPVGLNFDRVLEDTHLVAEQDGPRLPPTIGDRLQTIGRLLHRVPFVIAANTARVATRSHRKLGYAAVVVGSPVLASDHGFIGESGHANLDREERRAKVQAFCAHLKSRIEAVIPATPVPIFCLALRECNTGGDPEVSDLMRSVRKVLAQLRDANAPIALGVAFPRAQAAESDIPGLGAEVAAVSEAEMIVTLAGYALERRGMLHHERGRMAVSAEAHPLVDYYANSIVHHITGESGGATSPTEPSPEPPGGAAEE